MRIKLYKVLFAVCISAVIIAVLFWIADIQDVNLSHLKPSNFIAVVVTYICCIGFRAASLRSLAPIELHDNWKGWIRLAARHQILFTAIPSGAGDIGFPILANRYVGVKYPDAVRMIAQFRMRDLVNLMMIFIIGTISIGADSTYYLLAVIIGLLLLLWTDDITVILLSLATKVLPEGRVETILNTCIPIEHVGFKRRAFRTFYAVSSWLFAAIAIGIAFAAMGKTLSLGEILLVLVIMNILGAIAISIAGLGVTEAGVTGALISIGYSPSSAAATALITRPFLLFGIITACGILDFVVWLCKALSSDGASPSAETKQG